MKRLRCPRRMASGAALLLGCWASVGSAQGFTNVSAASGLDALRAEREADWWVSGLHFVDLDGDGALDVFLSSHGSSGALAALGDGMGHFTPVADGYPKSEIHIAYDVDEDGLVDLSMTHLDGGGRFWLNESSAGSLEFMATEVTREGNSSRVQVMLDDMSAVPDVVATLAAAGARMTRVAPQSRTLEDVYLALVEAS